jgi:hypothetical protein
MLEQINPYELNLQANIEIRSVDKSSGQTVETWSTAYTGVWMKRMSPPRGSEGQEANQMVATQRDTFKIREEGRTITAKDYRIVMNGEYYYITGVRPFKSSLNFKLLDTEKRDNT